MLFRIGDPPISRSINRAAFLPELALEVSQVVEIVFAGGFGWGGAWNKKWEIVDQISDFAEVAFDIGRDVQFAPWLKCSRNVF